MFHDVFDKQTAANTQIDRFIEEEKGGNPKLSVKRAVSTSNWTITAAYLSRRVLTSFDVDVYGEN